MVASGGDKLSACCDSLLFGLSVSVIFCLDYVFVICFFPRISCHFGSFIFIAFWICFVRLVFLLVSRYCFVQVSFPLVYFSFHPQPTILLPSSAVNHFLICHHLLLFPSCIHSSLISSSLPFPPFLSSSLVPINCVSIINVCDFFKSLFQ